MRKTDNDGFLELLAKKLLQDYGETISSLCLIFPSRRAALFFQHSLSYLIDKPIFAPRILTINDFSRVLSGYGQTDNLTLTAFLFAEMKRYYKEKGLNFDEYSPEIRIDQCIKMLSDFNDIDNYLLPAKDVFLNIYHLEELSSIDYLSPEQRETIESFWKVVLPSKQQDSTSKPEVKSASLREKFASFSGVIRELYPRYNELLKEKNIAYEGMMVKHAGSLSIEEVRSKLKEQFPFTKHFVVAGLYAITPAEERLLTLLKKALPIKGIQFFWEGFPLSRKGEMWNAEIVAPLKENIANNQNHFGGELLSPTPTEDYPAIEFIESSTQVSGRKVIPMLIDSILQIDPKAIEELRVAVILPEEKSLPPLLSSLSTMSIPLNVTMGYPLSSTNVAIWFTQYIEYLLSQRRLTDRTELSAELLDRLVRHPLSSLLLTEEEKKQLNEIKVYSLPYFALESLPPSSDQVSSKLFEVLHYPPRNAEELLQQLLEIADEFAIVFRGKREQDESTVQAVLQVDLEFLKKYQETLTALSNTLPIMSEDLDIAIVAQLLNSLVYNASVPFEGEPLKGLQVMGLLESRLLLFDYILIPDANERQFPRAYSEENTFIPFTLRVGYGLPIYRFKESIESYYFYRLLARSKKVFFVTGGVDDIEPSRYIAQLKYLSSASFTKKVVQLHEAAINPQAIEIEKTEEVMERLNRFLDSSPQKVFSPSTLNTYSICPLRFYFQHVRDIKEDLIEDDLLTPIDLGNVIHSSMENLYKNYIGNRVTQKDFIELQQQAKDVVLQQYKEIVFKGRKSQEDFGGIHEIYCNTAKLYVKAILQHDAKYEAIDYLESEHRIDFDFLLPDGKKVPIKGYIDRIDSVERDGEKVLRIIDYKTGTDELQFKNWEEIFPHKGETSKLNKAVSQLMLYCTYIVSNNKEYQDYDNVEPSLYILRQMIQNPLEYDPTLCMKESRETEKKEVINYKASLWQSQFEERLTQLLEEIFNPDEPFRQTEDKFNACRFCQFSTFCGM